MINGAHVVIYSRDAEADRRFLQEVLAFPKVDVGHGWLIFALPPSEAAVHPSDGSDRHELFLMSDDLDADIRRLKAAGAPCEEPQSLSWGRLTRLTLPGGGALGLYQPSHARPEWNA